MTEDVKDVPDENEENQAPRIQISPHPLGGIQVLARDPAGETLVTRIDLPEATILVSHLQALITMAFQTMYAQAVAEQQQRNQIIRPGGLG